MAVQKNTDTLTSHSDELIVLKEALNGGHRALLTALELAPDHFTTPGHRNLVKVCLSLEAGGLPVAIDTILDEGARLGVMGDSGFDPAFVWSLPTALDYTATSPEMARASATYLKTLSKGRTLARLLGDACQLALSAYTRAPGELDERIGKIQGLLALVDDDAQTLGTLTGEDLRLMAADDIERDPFAPFEGMPLGIPSIDAKLSGGVANGELCVLMARPGMGKTALLLNAGVNALAAGRRIGIVSLEMTPRELARRIVVCHGRVAMGKFKRAELSPGEKARAHKAAEVMTRDNLRLNGEANPNMAQIERLVYRWSTGETPIEALFVDYAQIVRHEDRETDRRVISRVDDVINRLKALAMAYNIPVFVAVQARRAVDDREDRIPHQGDGADCSTIEKAANVIISLDRPSRYNPAAPQDEARAFIAKQRDGVTGLVPLAWTGSHVLFHDYEERREHIESGYACSMAAQMDWDSTR